MDGSNYKKDQSECVWIDFLSNPHLRLWELGPNERLQKWRIYEEEKGLREQAE